MDRNRIQAIGRELEVRARTAQTIQNKYAAHFGLHTAAVLEKDSDQILEHRQALHVLLDRLLDNGESIQRLTDELTELSRAP